MNPEYYPTRAQALDRVYTAVLNEPVDKENNLAVIDAAVADSVANPVYITLDPEGRCQICFTSIILSNAQVGNVCWPAA